MNYSSFAPTSVSSKIQSKVLKSSLIVPIYNEMSGRMAESHDFFFLFLKRSNLRKDELHGNITLHIPMLVFSSGGAICKCFDFLAVILNLKKFSFVKGEILPVEPLFYNVHVLSLGKTFNLSPSWFLHQ